MRGCMGDGVAGRENERAEPGATPGSALEAAAPYRLAISLLLSKNWRRRAASPKREA